jgi:beta-mannosidase
LFGSPQETIELYSGWTVAWGDSVIPAMIPGYAQQDMLAHGLLPDPYHGTNEKAWKETFSQDYTYVCSFEIPGSVIKREHIELVFEGIDTAADIFLNGEFLGKVCNMFRAWRFDILSSVRAGENELSVIIKSPEKEIERLHNTYKDWTLDLTCLKDYREFIRKEQCSFGWDWGIYLPCSGIRQPVRLEAWDTVRIESITVDTKTSDDFSQANVEGTVVFSAGVPGNACLYVSLSSPSGRIIQIKKPVVREPDSTAYALTIHEPELWWPNGLGKQPLYALKAELNVDGKTVSVLSRRIGIRKLEVMQEPDDFGKSFYFRINNIPVFAKGANWIPPDALWSRMNNERYVCLLEAARDAHMNMIRVWGGGTYESDVFYDACDELGLLVWQDLMFACGIYPVYDDFLRNTSAEVSYQVKRLQSHPCIALWCGNNECEEAARGWVKVSHADQAVGQHELLFENVLRGVVMSADPTRLYWPSSSHSPNSSTPKRQDCGDTHFWDVWHGGKPFEAYLERTDRFMSEFGYQSFPDMHTIRTFAAEEQLELNSPVMMHHQRCSTDGNQRIMNRITERWGTPGSFEDFVYLSQLQQAEAIRMGVEHWRRNRNGNHCMGTLYWQLNDCWPVISWSSLDYYGRWKALHYAARRFFAPLLVSMFTKNEIIHVYVINDTAESLSTSIAFTLGTYDGKTIAEKNMTVTVPASSALCVCEVPVQELIGNADPACHYLAAEAEYTGDGSRSVLHFKPFKEAHLADPKLNVTVEGTHVTVGARCFAKGVVLLCEYPGVQFSDNYFDLLPGEQRTVELLPLHPEEYIPEILPACITAKCIQDMILKH